MSRITRKALKQFCPEDFPSKDILHDILPEYISDPEEEPFTEELHNAIVETMQLLKTIVVHLYTDEVRCLDTEGYGSPYEVHTPKQLRKLEFLKFMVKDIISCWYKFSHDKVYRDAFFEGSIKMVQIFQTSYTL